MSEFKAEVVKLQNSLYSNLNVLQQTHSRLMERDRDRRRCDLTLHELSTLDASTRVYKALGKAFVHVPNDQIVGELITTSKKCTEEIKTLKDMQQRLSHETSKLEKELKEMMK
ncbi:hypothetical protein RCL1_008889 [Eukaryota sp. TZLM3-RCL]